jgi:hypothetical protein
MLARRSDWRTVKITASDNTASAAICRVEAAEDLEVRRACIAQVAETKDGFHRAQQRVVVVRDVRHRARRDERRQHHRADTSASGSVEARRISGARQRQFAAAGARRLLSLSVRLIEGDDEQTIGAEGR